MEQQLLWLDVIILTIGTLWLMNKLMNTTPWYFAELMDMRDDLLVRRSGGKENFPMPIALDVISWPRVFLRWCILMAINFAAGLALWSQWSFGRDDAMAISSSVFVLLALEYLIIRFIIPYMFHHKYEKDLGEVQALHEPQVALLIGRVVDDSRDPQYKGDHLASGGRIITICTQHSDGQESRHSLFLPFGAVHPYGRNLSTSGPVSVFYEVGCSSIDGCIGRFLCIRTTLYGPDRSNEDGFGLTRPLAN